MQSLTRWKLACAVLAVVSTFEFLVGDDRDAASPNPGRSRSADVSRAFHAPAASRADIETIVRRLRTARSFAEIRSLTQQLGVIGDDKAIDDVRSLVFDRRPMVPNLILQAIGNIGTDHAVDVLVGFAEEHGVRDAAVESLGYTHNAHAEPVLSKLAIRGDLTAITALGELGTDGSVEALYQLASTNGEPGKYAIAALGESAAPEAPAMLRKLIDSPSIEVAASAIAAIQDVDDELFAKLLGIVQAGEAGLVDAALTALVHAGERALPILRETALHGAHGTRGTAVAALARLGTDEATSTLASILETGDMESARAAIEALSEVDTEASRELLISSALSERRNFTGALDTLLRMKGPDIEQALLTIAKTDREHRYEVLTHLMMAGNAEGLAIVNDLVLHGNEAERMQALVVLDEGGTQATDTLVALARTQTGATQLAAINLLAQHAGNPEVARLLRDRLEHGGPEEAAAAAAALANAGTQEARDALVAALSNGDDDLTRIALDSLGQFRLTDDMSNALLAAAHANPDLAPAVMSRLVNEGSPKGLELARTALASNDSDVAAEALDSLQLAGTPAAIKLIEGTLSSRDEDLRRRAITSLGTLRATGAEETVIGALRDESPAVREAAMRALGDLGTDRAKASLMDLARNGGAEDKAIVISSMQSIDDPTIGQALVGMMRDSNPSVAISAIDAVISRGTNIDSELTSIASNPSTPIEVRIRAARPLADAGLLDPRLREELDTASGGEWSSGPNPDDPEWD